MKQKRLINVIKVILFLGCFFVLHKVLNYLIVDDATLARLMWHDFYESENIDICMIGASHVLRGYNVDVANSITGKNTFNMGTASQTLDGSYYSLCELLKYNDVDTVYLDVSFVVFQREIGQVRQTSLITDYIKGANKYKYILGAVDSENYFNVLSALCRSDAKNINLKHIRENIKNKNTDTYKEYLSINGYIKNGFAVLESTKGEYDYFAFNIANEFDFVDLESFKDEEIYYLNKFVDLCKQNSVHLVLVSMPTTPIYTYISGDYDSFVKWMSAYAKEHDIEYYNFNLLKEDVFTEESYSNRDHLTLKGATEVTQILSEIYVGGGEHEFVNSIKDKPPKEIVGITYKLSSTSDYKTYEFNIVTDLNIDFSLSLYEVDEFGNKDYIYNMTDDKELTVENKSRKALVLEIYDRSTGRFMGNALVTDE